MHPLRGWERGCDGRWPVEIGRFEGGDTPRRALGRSSENGPPAELTVLTDLERRIAESRSYRALVDRVYEDACDNRTQALPELREIRARNVEVFDDRVNAGPPRRRKRPTQVF